MGRGPLIILLHGVSSNAYIFLPMMQILAKEFHVVSLEMRGHGRSSKPASGYAADNFADDLAAVVSRFDQSAVVVGHALGAWVAMHTADKYPAQLKALVAIEFLPFIEAEVFKHLQERVLKGQKVYEDEATLRRELSRRYVNLPPEAIDRRIRYGFTEGAARYQPLAERQALKSICEALSQPFQSLFMRIRQPTLMIRGENSVFVTRDAWRKAAIARPDFARCEILGTDHYLCEESPIIVSSEITNFLKGL